VHAVDEVQDTDDSVLEEAPLGFGVVWIDHSVPFQPSASVTVVPELFTYSPVAIHEVDDAHETPQRLLFVAPLGFGVVWIDHEVPFHRSASVTVVPELLT
jgi:hypothetical protein